MPVLTVAESGSASIQGLGRYGGQRFGLSPGGAMDRLALAEANALVGQPYGAAAVETGPLPFRLLVDGGPIRLAMSGARRDVRLNDRRIDIGTTFLVRNGDELRLRGARDGMFTYLAVQGGLQGGRQARRHLTQPGRSWVLHAGDELDVLAAARGQAELRLNPNGPSEKPIRVVLGPDLDQFTLAAAHRFLLTRWSVSTAANRMAYLLEGGRVEQRTRPNRISDGTVTGNIQIAGSGQPVVILCDRGTVGGYPKIATIISADIGRFAQTPVAGGVAFEPVSVVEAQAVARDFAERVASVKSRLRPLHAELSVDSLAEGNLAGDAFDAMLWVSEGAPRTARERLS